MCREIKAYLDKIFFIKDILIRENIELIHCSTERMIVDFYTKSLQGSPLRKIRDIIIDLAPISEEGHDGNDETRTNRSDKN